MHWLCVRGYWKATIQSNHSIYLLHAQYGTCFGTRWPSYPYLASQTGIILPHPIVYGLVSEWIWYPQEYCIQHALFNSEVYLSRKNILLEKQKVCFNPAKVISIAAVGYKLMSLNDLPHTKSTGE